jgi:predicted phage terminase large subunit-like protein
LLSSSPQRTQLRARAELERRRRGPSADRAAVPPPSLATFVEQTSTIVLEDWQQRICARLERLLHEQGQRVLIHGPPQHGKSLIVSQRLPIYAIGRRPDLRVRLACYNQTHAERFSVTNLAIGRSAEYRAAFSSADAHVPERCKVEEWSVPARQSKLDANPSFKALGLGTGFTGLGADLLVIDDPYKDRDDALSPAINASVWGWWTDVVLPRLNPATNVVVMFHRWQADDFAGKLLEQGEWESWRFPAIADGLADDRSGQAVGEALSARYPLAYLEAVRLKQGASFQALYQGTPFPPNGVMVGRDHLPIVAAAPVELLAIIRYWDIAAADPGKGDYTVGVLLGLDTHLRWWVLHVERFQKKDHHRNAHIRSIAHSDTQRYGRVPMMIELPPGIARESIQALVRHLAGFVVAIDPVNRDKVTRFEPFKDQAVVGNVALVEGAWNEDYIQELVSFPLGKHDDQADATSGGHNALAALLDAAEEGETVVYDERVGISQY